MIAIEVTMQPARITADPGNVTVAAIDSLARDIAEDIEARLRQFGPVEPFGLIIAVGEIA